MSLAILKQYNPKNLQSLTDIKFEVSPIKDIFGKKFFLGCFCGIIVYSGLFFSSQATYMCSIPMYLVNRRCVIVATIIAGYYFNKTIPTKAVAITAFLYCFGSLICGWETLEQDWIGFGVVWIFNFT